MFATEDERQQCANLMTGAPQNEGFDREGEITEYSYAKESEFMERVRRSGGGGGDEEGQVALLEARSCILTHSVQLNLLQTVKSESF